ncbi:site-specific integrase [Xenophilus sp. Marseille-Q4582]|uniref:site-specific integrase n=1 Tax=Xenophilus sp. Marseille-Q4582 TaxID=2866600 RepID=UPI001CE44417|nr:site-specific integrase [Xenophilus sp. Marseille-Q4582]
MASIQPRGSKFQLRIKHKLLPKPFFFTFNTEAEAVAYGNQLEALLDKGLIPQELLTPKKGDAVQPLLLDVVNGFTKDPHVLIAQTELPTLELLVKECAGLRMSDLTFDYVNKLIAKYKERKLAPGTIRKRIGALSKVVDWYCRTYQEDGKVVHTNVLKMLPRGYSQYANREVKDEHRDRRLTPEEAARIQAALAGEKREGRERAWGPDPDFEMLYELLVETGLRLKEAFSLPIERIDTQKAIIHLAGSKGHHGAEKPRTVPLKKALREKLKTYIEGRSGLVFPFWDGTKEDVKRCQLRLSSRFSTLFDFAQIPDITTHDLRHEACCRWITLRDEKGWIFNEMEICKIMGWTDPKIMLRYASLRGEDLSSRLL